MAKLSLVRPGWHPACLSRIAKQLGGEVMYKEFREHGPDRFPKNAVDVAAVAIANLRGKRLGIAASENVLGTLTPKFRDEVTEDATAALDALLKI